MRSSLYVMAPCAGTSGEVAFAAYSLPNGTSNGSERGLPYTIPAGGFGIIPDVVNEFGQTGGATLYLNVTVYAYSATQVSLEGFRIGSPGGSIRAVAVTSSFYFEAAAVTVDNLTNDGFFRHFTDHDFQPVRPGSVTRMFEEAPSSPRSRGGDTAENA